MFSTTFIVFAFVLVLLVLIYIYWPKKVRIYQGESLYGKYKDLEVGNHTIEQIGFKDIYAVRVPKGLLVTIEYSDNSSTVTSEHLIYPYPTKIIKSIKIVDEKDL
jgi:hypothetical protein